MNDNQIEPVRSHGRLAFDRIARELAEVNVDSGFRYTIDAGYASTTALGIAHRLQPYRARLAALPEFEIRHLDRLEDYANALRFVHNTLVFRAQRVRELPELADEGLALRKSLMAYAELLVIEEVFDEPRVALLRPGTGYRDLMADLEGLVILYREQPEVTATGFPISDAKVDRAEAIAIEMAHQLGIDKDADLSHAALIDARSRVATLLLRAQSQLRRAMAYLRYDEGDAVQLVPSLYVPSKPRKKGSDPTEPDMAEDLAALHDAMHAEETHRHPHDNPFVDA